MEEYDKVKDEEKTKTQVLEEHENDNEKTQEVDKEETVKEEKKEHLELEEGHDVRRIDTNASDELDMREIVMNISKLKAMIKVLIVALVILGVLLIYIIFKTSSYKSEIKDLQNQLKELSNLAIQNATVTKEEDKKEKLNVMTYHELNSILLKFTESVVDENTDFEPKVWEYKSGLQNSYVAYLVQHLFENNKTIPEMNSLKISRGRSSQNSKDMCYVINTITPVKVKLFSLDTLSFYDHLKDCDFKFLSRVTSSASIYVEGSIESMALLIKASYHLEELKINFEQFTPHKELDLSINSTYKIKSISFSPYYNEHRQDINLYDTILKGISESGLKESLQKISLSPTQHYYCAYQNYEGELRKSITNITEIIKKYGLENIELKCG